MLATPDLTHLEEADYDSLYEPAEDSFLLLDALEADLEPLLESLPACPLILEIGPGTGIASSFVQAQILGPHGRSGLTLAVDINPRACTVTLETCRRNLARQPPTDAAQLVTDVVRGSLLDALHLNGQIDLLLFNPPYVPTTEMEIDLDGGSLAATWAGGAEGMSVTAQVFPLLQHVLSRTGVFYLVAVARNRPEKLLAQAEAFGCRGEMVLERRAGREKLCVLRFCRLVTAETSP